MFIMGLLPYYQYLYLYFIVYCILCNGATRIWSATLTAVNYCLVDNFSEHYITPGPGWVIRIAEINKP